MLKHAVDASARGNWNVRGKLLETICSSHNPEVDPNSEVAHARALYPRHLVLACPFLHRMRLRTKAGGVAWLVLMIMKATPTL